MNRIEHADSVEAHAGDPIDAIVGLAQECRAHMIAGDARRVSERLESGRLFVAVVGSRNVLCQMLERIAGQSISSSILEARPLSVRFGSWPTHLRVTFRDRPPRKVPLTWHDRLHAFGNDVVATELLVESTLARHGVVYCFGTLDGLQSHRVDLVLVDKQDAGNAKIEKWHGVRIVVLDTSRSGELDAMFAAIERTAIETGAARVEAHLSQHARNLCLRLQQHLREHQRALSRGPHDLATRINSLSIVHVLAETTLDARSQQPDPARERLADWLAVERKKFLMSTKADALVAFDERLASRGRPRHQLRRDAAAAVDEVVEDFLASFWERSRVRADAPIVAHTKELLADLETALADLGEPLPIGAMTGFDLLPIRGFRRVSARPASSGVITHLADHIRLASRKRIETIARTEVVTRLESGASQLITKLLADYDDTRYAIERRFCELIDGALESARLAAEFAKQPQSEGADGVARARSRIERWVTSLSAIMARIA